MFPIEHRNLGVSSIAVTVPMSMRILPVSAVSRGAHGFFTDDPLFTVAVRFACIPLNVFCHFLREDPGLGGGLGSAPRELTLRSVEIH